MKALSDSFARFNISGLCLIAALGAGCTFDASQLRALPDAPTATGGSAGSTGTGGAGGIGAAGGAGGIGGAVGITSGGGRSGVGGSGSGSDAGVPDAPGAQPDAFVGGSGGGAVSGGGSGGSGDAGMAVAAEAQPEVPTGGTDGGADGADFPAAVDAPSSETGTAVGAETGPETFPWPPPDATDTQVHTRDASAQNDAGVAGGPDAQPDVPIGGTDGSAGADSGTPPPSCSGLAATCGPSGNDSCCTSLLVPGGTFYRSYDGVDYMDPNYPATVSDFNLDKYEITVGRFRVFVNAGMGTQANPPAAGAGAPPGIAGSGWDSTWNTNLPANTAALTTNLKCGSAYQTWTDTAGGNESKPVNCLDWYTAFAFCAWDGGRLATEAEWNYAASGGSEQRSYPWSNPATSTTINDSYAVYCGGSCSGTQNVGSKSPTGDGKWGQSDLAGNVWEWTLDWYASPYSMPCNNCADLTAASSRVIRGGSFDNFASDLRSAGRRGSDYRGSDNYVVGSRCARSVSGTPGTGGAGGAAGSAGGSDAGMAGAGGGGGTPTTLASGQNGPSGIVVDAASVYWLNRGNGTVMSVPIGGGTPTTLASGQNNPNGIAIDATSVYWVNWGDGTVMKTLISGGTPTALASGQNSATAGSAIAVDGTSVYWTSAPSGTVMKLTPK